MAILIDETTRILVQGITGREAAGFSLESLNYGARIVAGVTPGKGGEHIHGIPVFDTVESALRDEPCDASVIAVPARFALDAVLEAVEHGLQLIVLVTERIPRRDVVEMLEAVRTAGSRLIGPNSMGVISPGMSRLGMCGGAARTTRLAYTPGPVGVMSRSGGMMTEIASMLTLAGIGQTTCVSIGGDPMIGATFLDLLPLYEADPDTQALALFCEPGGVMEEDLAQHLEQHPSRLPIVAFITGRFMDNIPGVRFGHAGAIVEGNRGSPLVKAARLQAAGVRIAERTTDIPNFIKAWLY